MCCLGKSEDLIESIDKASKASEVSEYCESLEDIQQYNTDNDKKVQKQVLYSDPLLIHSTIPQQSVSKIIE